MEINTCEGCDLYENGHCRKWSKDGRPEPAVRDWFSTEKYGETIEFIPVERMCRKGSIYGNYFVGLSKNDLERLMNGEVAYIRDEYGVFIGLLPEDKK